MTETAVVSGAAARAVGARKILREGDAAVHALAGVTFDFPAQEFTAIVGPSGSGRSTLMQCVAGLDRMTDGQARCAHSRHPTHEARGPRSHPGHVMNVTAPITAPDES